MTERAYAEWLVEHKGRLVDTVADVWECDDECGCSQAVIVERYENKVLGLPWIVPVCIWEGPYHHDFESGAKSELDAEVARRNQSLLIPIEVERRTQ